MEGIHTKKEIDLSIMEFRIEYLKNLRNNLLGDKLRFPDNLNLICKSIENVESAIFNIKTLIDNENQKA